MNRLQGLICTPTGFVAGTIEWSADTGRIGHIEGEPVSSERIPESSGPIILPGFIDSHVHGGGGPDIMEGGDARDRCATCTPSTARRSCLPPP